MQKTTKSSELKRLNHRRVTVCYKLTPRYSQTVWDYKAKILLRYNRLQVKSPLSRTEDNTRVQVKREKPNYKAHYIDDHIFHRKHW